MPLTVDELDQELVDQVRAEVRTDLAREIAEQFLGVSRASRRVYRGASADDCILEALAEYPTLAVDELQAALDRFDEDGITDDFRAGVLFAVRLVADLDYEY